MWEFIILVFFISLAVTLTLLWVQSSKISLTLKEGFYIQDITKKWAILCLILFIIYLLFNPEDGTWRL